MKESTIIYTWKREQKKVFTFSVIFSWETKYKTTVILHP